MDWVRYSGGLLAVAIAGYGGAAHGQEDCERQIEQLQTQVQESELETQTKRELESQLDDARNANDAECQSRVGEVREQLDAAQIAQPPAVADAGAGNADLQDGDISEAGSPEAHADPNVHVVESETVAQTAPREQTEAEVVIEEPVDQDVRSALPSEEPPTAASASTRQQASQSTTIGDAEAMELVGRPLRSREGEEIGEITEVARSLVDQQLHALVDIGGLLGVGERTVSIPIERADIDSDGTVTTQMSRDEIENMEVHDPTLYASIEEGDDETILR